MKKEHYTSKAYIKQIEIGEDYPKLNQVIFLGIVNFNMFIGENHLTNHLILNKETLINEISDFRFCFIELTKFTKTESELLTVADKWIYFLKNAKNLKIIPANVVEKEIQEAYSILDKFNWTPEEFDYYERYSVALQDARGRIEQGFIDGMEKGLEKGKIEGKIEIALEMIKDNETIERIIKYTGLTEAKINELLEKFV